VRVTHEVAFVRGTAHQGDAKDPIALCTGAFMIIRGGVMGIPS
jgi:acyl-coenzyme A thioesterase PaaI-like protein